MTYGLRKVLLGLTLASAALAGTSCALPSSSSERQTQRKYTDAPEPNAALQSRVMELADDYIAGLSEAVYVTLGKEDLTPQGRALAQSFLRNGVGSALDIGAGPNPSINLLDLLVLSSLQTRSFETHWIPAGIGPAGAATLEKLKLLNASIWSDASDLLTVKQREVLQQLIDAWIAQHTDRMVVSLVRFREFADSRNLSSAALRREASGLLKEVTVVSSAIDDARLLGERLLWYSGRYPFVLGQQAELTVYRLAAQPESEKLLASLESVNQLAKKLENRLDTLPDALSREQQRFFEGVTDERTRTIEQAERLLAGTLASTMADIEKRYRVERDATLDLVIDRLGRESEALFQKMEKGQVEVRGMLADVQLTLAATNTLAKEVTGTVDAIDRVVTRFAYDPANPSEPLKMEDIREIAQSAEVTTSQVARTIEELNRLINSGEVERRMLDVTGPLNASIDRAFYRGLILVVVLLAGLALIRLIPKRTRVV